MAKRKQEAEEEVQAKKEKKGDLKTVAFQGIKGSYSEEAAISYFSEVEIETLGFKTVLEVFQKVQEGELDYGVVPIENSDTGSFKQIYDLLLDHKLFISGECAVQDDHCLVALPGVTKEHIKKVYSHLEAIDQCRVYLDKFEQKYQKVERLGVWNTAYSCELIKRDDLKDAAAIASRKAAKIHGLDVLESNIGGDHRATRYVVLARSPASLPIHGVLPRKTSIAVVLKNELGALFKCVSCFALRGISISKFEARPASTGRAMFESSHHWQYLFYIDFEPSRHQEVNDALFANLREYCLNVRDLGTYLQNLPSKPSPTWADGALM